MPVSRDDLDRIVEAKKRVKKPTPKKRKRMPKAPLKSYGTGLAAYRKTLAGVLTPVVTYALAKWALDLPPEVVAPLVGVLTGVIVWATPNKLIDKSYGTG